MRNIILIILILAAVLGLVFALRNSSTDLDANPTPTPRPSDHSATLHSPCMSENDCAIGQTCLNYFGIAGQNGPLFRTCEISCVGEKTCPDEFQCVTIADGPGKVCDFK